MGHQFAARNRFQGRVDVNNTRYLSLGFNLLEKVK